MHAVTIIGGGLSGLAAARELDRLHIPYTLIEVKNRLGGSIISERRAGCVLDGGPSVFETGADWSFLPDLGLSTDDLCPAVTAFHRNLVVFRHGTQVVTDALARGLTGSILHRMAVSSLGWARNRFELCMENGLIFTASAVILAAPARYAERMLRTLAPEVSLRLLDYGYDTITRLSLVYRSGDVPLPPALPWDMAVPFYYGTDDPHRAAPGHILIHAGIRFPLAKTTPEALVDEVGQRLNAQAAPLHVRPDYWPECDPLPPFNRHFAEQMAALNALLPPGIALAGSDYQGVSLAARVAGGRAAARQVAAWLNTESPG